MKVRLNTFNIWNYSPRCIDITNTTDHQMSFGRKKMNAIKVIIYSNVSTHLLGSTDYGSNKLRLLVCFIWFILIFFRLCCHINIIIIYFRMKKFANKLFFNPLFRFSFELEFKRKKVFFLLFELPLQNSDRKFTLSYSFITKLFCSTFFERKIKTMKMTIEQLLLRSTEIFCKYVYNSF